MLLRELVENLASHGVTVKEATGTLDVEVARVVEDSRQVRPGDLFVARGGTKLSGADYVADAVAKGAVAVVMERHEGTEAQRHEGIFSVPVVYVDDVALALGVLAHAIHGWPGRGMTCVGVTGTKGKTTVAYLLRSVLRAVGKKVGMIGTVEIDDGKTIVESDMTTPGPVEMAGLLAKMRENGVGYLVMEVSSHALHQKRVAGIEFGVAIFTNLTGDHLDYHKTMEEYAAAKALLFEGLKEGALAVVNADDQWVGRMVEGCKAKVVRYGIREWLAPVAGRLDAESSGLDWVGEILSMTSSGMDLQVLGRWNSRGGENWAKCGRMPVKTPLVGRHNVYNLLSVIAGATVCGVEWSTLATAIEDDDGVPGRLQAVVSPGMRREDMQFQVFVDYAHTHDALENVLKALRAIMVAGDDESRSNARDMLSGIASRGLAERETVRAAEHGSRSPDTHSRLICVFGCGGDRDRTKRPKMGAIAQRLADVAIVTSDNPRTEEPGAIIDEVCAGFTSGWRESGRVFVEADRRAAITMAIGMAQKGDVVLIAGKGHENYQIVGTTKHHFDDVEEATAAIENRLKPVLRT